MSAPALNLEFGARRWTVSRTAMAIFALSVLLLAWVAWQAGQTLMERSRQGQLLAERQQAMRKDKPPEVKPEHPDPADVAQAQFARQTVRSLNTPWAELLQVLEKAPSNVALLAVEPSAAKRVVSITAEAANPEDMIHYLEALHADGRLTNIAMVSHQTQAQAPGTPLRFQLRANWGGAQP